MKISTAKHLPEIDGLRAVAVLAVVLYHANVPGFSAGYLGVDIFFVISGYLITGLLHHEGQHTGRIDFLAFYARRFRRLLPALAIVLVTTLLAAWVILFPAELPRLSKAATAVLLMFSNIHFMQYSGGYFDPSVDVMPLLHTWSLSVEEQFYLFWPLLLAGCFALARKFTWNVDRLLAGTLSVAILASFAYWLGNLTSNPNNAFYMMPARVWELALGGLINFLPGASRHQRHASPPVRHLSSIALAVIAATLCLPLDPDKYTALLYPAAVLATTVLIYAIHCHSSSAGVQILLKNKLAIYIGLVSYSFYLWHWPLLSLGRAYYLGERLLLRDLSLVLLSLVLAYASYRWIETPVRRKRPWPFSTDRNTLKAALAIILAIGLLGHQAKEWGMARNTEITREIQGNSTIWGKERLAINAPACHEPKEGTQLAPQADCRRGPQGSPLSVVAWGDSHAGHLEGMLYPLAQQAQQQYLLRSFGACPPLVDAAPVKGGSIQLPCAERNRLVFEEIRTLAGQGLKTVVLGGRWNSYLAMPETNPAAITSYALVDHWQEAQEQRTALKVGKTPLDTAGSLDTLEKSLRRTLEALSAMNLEVLLMAPVPEPYFNAPHCLYRKSEAECRFSRQRVDERRRETLLRLQNAARDLPRVHLIDPIGYFCDQQACRVQKDGFSIYWDTDHLTLEMGHYLSQQLGPRLPWLWATPGTPR